ncbi:MAG: hypothetical protein ACI4LE_04930 [Faecalibacterium sp.]
MEDKKQTADREAELARREAILAQREAQLAQEQAELEALRAAQESGETGKKGFLNNGDPNFKNPKEKMYDHFPLTVHQMDIIIGVLFALIALFLILGFTHTSFFGLFGG